VRHAKITQGLPYLLRHDRVCRRLAKRGDAHIRYATEAVSDTRALSQARVIAAAPDP
jgi:hypothetical protein